MALCVRALSSHGLILLASNCRAARLLSTFPSCLRSEATKPEVPTTQASFEDLRIDVVKYQHAAFRHLWGPRKPAFSNCLGTSGFVAMLLRNNLKSRKEPRSPANIFPANRSPVSDGVTRRCLACRAARL